MDDKSKLIIMLFFESLRRNMSDIDDPNLPRMSPIEERGYFNAVEKMNFFIQQFIDNEIEK